MPTIIYCDLDGVLHRWPCAADEMFDAGCIARLEATIQPHAVEIVITSTWRLEWSLPNIRDKMGILGRYVVGVTPEIDDPFLKFARHHEVLRYHGQHAPAVSRWIAIDDEAGRYPAGLQNLVLCDPRTGFEDKDAVKLTRLLDILGCSARSSGPL